MSEETDCTNCYPYEKYHTCPHFTEDNRCLKEEQAAIEEKFMETVQ